MDDYRLKIGSGEKTLWKRLQQIINDIDTRIAVAGGVTSVAGRTGAVTLTKTDVGLSNVDNTADTSKPISTAMQAALDGKAATTHSHTGAVQVHFRGGGVALTTSVDPVMVQIPYSGTITGWTILGDQAGSVSIDIQKDSYANYPPTGGDSIVASAPPTVTSAVKNTSTTLTGWTTAVSSGDVLRFVLNSVSGFVNLDVTLNVTRS